MLNTKTINQLKRHYKEHEPEDDSKIKEEDQKMRLDETMIMGFVPKTKYTEQVFMSLFDVEHNINVREKMKYDKTAVTVSFSLEYLKEVLKILTAVDDLNKNCSITLQIDCPVCFEIDEFKTYLAPRVNRGD